MKCLRTAPLFLFLGLKLLLLSRSLFLQQLLTHLFLQNEAVPALALELPGLGIVCLLLSEAVAVGEVMELGAKIGSYLGIDLITGGHVPHPFFYV